MKKLKNILQFKYIFFIVLLCSIFLSFVRIENNKVSFSSSFEGVLKDYKIDGDKVSFILKNKTKLKCTYYASTEDELNNIKKWNLGITLKVNGEVGSPSNNTIPNTFNYSKYLKSKNIFKIMTVQNYKVINKNLSLIYKIKNKIIKRISKYKSNNYLSAFILGDKSYLKSEIKSMYQDLGVSHIFAISGMHITLITTILFFLLKKVKENIKYLIIISFLIIYIFLTDYQASVLRSVSFFVLSFINKKYLLNIDKVNLFFLSITILMLIFPNLVYDVGFLYSTSISFTLIRFSNLIKGNYIISLIIISTISFLVSLPITINNNYEINIFSIINNIFIVPYISLLLYPLSILTFFIYPLDGLMLIFSNIVEDISMFLINFQLVVPKIPIIIIIIYYSCLYVFFSTYKKHYLLFAILIIFINKSLYILDNNMYIYYLDVSQGDSTLIKYKNEAILIDTGGKVSFKTEKWKQKTKYYITDSTMLFLKSIGITKLNTLITTHGDYDHMGEATNLINNFKVEKVIFNCGEYNDLENELIKVLDKKKIKYYSCIKELNSDDNKLYFLQTKEYDNENENSNVIYFKYNNFKFLFMGDAGIEKEKDILNKYNLANIDVLKVGHHGSKTSSSEYFIDETKPKYSIISVGKNNRYGHPNKEVLNNLENTKIYRTDKNGTIMFKIKNDKLKIKTCSS